jgi:hypothetical protein
MTATCSITREGDLVFNPDTFQDEPTTTTVYPVDPADGICRVKKGGTQDTGKTAADQVFVESMYELHLPVLGSEDVRKDDVAEILTCPDDPALVGRKLRIVAGPASSQTTARRFPVEVTQ